MPPSPSHTFVRMPRIAILSTSVRTGRASHRVALHLERSIREAGHEADLIDLDELAFPLFSERLKFQEDPAPATVAFAERIRQSDAVVFVTPEYNGSIPASVKNVVDLLVDEWRRKPVGIAAVSSGAFGGTQALMVLLTTLWKIKAWVSNTPLNVPKVKDQFNEEGVPADPDAWAKRTKGFLDDLLWCVEAVRRMAS